MKKRGGEGREENHNVQHKCNSVLKSAAICSYKSGMQRDMLLTSCPHAAKVSLENNPESLAVLQRILGCFLGVFLVKGWGTGLNTRQCEDYY